MWRFLNTGVNDGPFNMAVDEVLANIVPTKQPSFRVYLWKPNTISTGFHQKNSNIDLPKCKKNGVGIVRRPTGGGAIFHAQEVTYSIIIPKKHHLFAKNTIEIYNLISVALANGLALLVPGIVLERSNRNSEDFKNYHNKFACFATSAQYEILHNSRKLVGSAQRRFKNGLLQHGSIMLGDDHVNLLNYLTTYSANSREQALASLKRKTTSLSGIVGRKISPGDVVQNLKKGVEETFAIQLEDDVLSKQEMEAIEELKLKLK